MNNSDLAYRRTAAASGSGFEVLIALYDTLAGDLRRAAEAQRSNDIEQRCRESGHAILVLGQLQSWQAQAIPGELSSQLACFYQRIKKDLLDAQVAQSADAIASVMHQVLAIRALWQHLKDSQATQVDPQAVRPSESVPSYAGNNFGWLG